METFDQQAQRRREAAGRAAKDYLATLDDAAYGAASPVTPKFISPSDPAAQWTGAMKSAAFFAYADNYLIDVKFGNFLEITGESTLFFQARIERPNVVGDLPAKLRPLAVTVCGDHG